VGRSVFRDLNVVEIPKRRSKGGRGQTAGVRRPDVEYTNWYPS